VAWRAELSGVALAAEDREQIFEGVTEALAVIVGELINDLEEALERLGIAVRQIGEIPSP
jgi:predicted RNase H-like HicB family nuclease